MEDEDNKVFMAMSSAMAEIVEDTVEVYWLTKHFYRIHGQSANYFTLMVSRVLQKQKMIKNKIPVLIFIYLTVRTHESIFSVLKT